MPLAVDILAAETSTQDASPKERTPSMVEHSLRREIKSLTGLRFFAAFYVFVFHMHLRWPLTGNVFLENIIGQGAVGMTLFFMLSGFVLAYQYEPSTFSNKTFFINRFSRIYPVYIAAAILTLPALGLHVSGTVLSSEFWTGIAKITVLVVANILLVQAWIPQFFQYWNDGGSWSISAEVFFYALFPAIMKPIQSASVRVVLMVALAAYIFSIIPAAAYMLFDKASCQSIYYSMPIFRLPEFIMGICAWKLSSQRAVPMWMLSIGTYLGLIILFSWLGTAGAGLPLYVTNNFIVEPVVMLLFISLSSRDSVLSKGLASAPMAYAGKISYCFYSLQPVFIMALMNHHDRLILNMPILHNNYVLCAATLMMLTAASAAAYKFIEEPCRRYLKNRAAKQQPGAIEPALCR